MCASMSEFDDIRPYEDQEVADVISRLVADESFNKAATNVMMPAALQGSVVGGLLTKMLLRLQTRGFKTIKQCQLLMAEHFANLVAETMDELSIDGLQHLKQGEAYLFISNHRDIVLDSSSLNYLLHSADHETSRSAVGDNLLTNPLAADLMRLNKSFVVQRSATGTKAIFTAMLKTSRYIRASLEEGVSIWIAQREGRAKDGYDRTDPAVLKMLALAYRDEGGLTTLTEQVKIVPVSVSYEVDPCARRKAHELYVTETEGSYEKTEREDVDSIIEGVVGDKGRVHLQVHPPVQGVFDEADALARALDQSIVHGIRIFPTHVESARRLAVTDPEFGEIPEADVAVSEDALAKMSQDLEQCPEVERPYLLRQYANVIRNRKALPPSATSA